MKILATKFLERNAVIVAKELIGCTLARKYRGKTLRYVITETEAYDGLKDMASHAFRGKTKRNEIMWNKAGHIYVYFTYGMHWLLNIVTDSADHPSAVLIRGVKDIHSDLSLNGPARLTKALGITGVVNRKRLGKATGLWLEIPPEGASPFKVKCSPRIGVDYAGPIWSKKKWRFTMLNESDHNE